MKRILLMVCFAAVGWGQTRGTWEVAASALTNDGHIYHLRGHAEIRGVEVTFRADAIDYDEDKAVMHLAGHVTIETKTKGSLSAEEADYDVNSGDLRLRVKLTPAQ